MDHHEFVNDSVYELVIKGAALPVDYPPRVISPLSVATQRTKLRRILDLRYVNDHLERESTRFQYENLHTAADVLQPDDHMFTVDLEAAYHHVETHPDCYQYLGCEWQGQFHVFSVLPSGLATACWVSSRLCAN